MKFKKQFKKSLPFLIILLTSVLLILPMMIYKKVGGDDLLYHFQAINALDTAYHNGTFFSRIYELTCQDYGYASGIFYSMIPSGMITIIKNIFHIPAIVSIYIVLIIVLFLSGLFVYLLLNDIFENKTLNLILCLVYISSPYIVANIYNRFALTEIFLTFLIPMIAIALYNFVEKQNYKIFMIYFVIGYSLLFMIHMTMTIFITIFSALYLLLNIKKILNIKSITQFATASIFAICISSMYWLPVLFAKSGINLDYMACSGEFIYSATSIISKNMFLNFVSIFMLSVYITYLIVFLINIKKNNKNEKIIFTLSTIMFICVTPLGIFWKFINNSIFNLIQFPWRIYLPFSLMIVFELKYLLCKIKKQSIKIYFSGFAFALLISAFIFNISSNNKFTKSFDNQINYLSTNNGTGSVKMGDYYPKNTTRQYVYNRANEKMLIESDILITEFANYQSKNQINFEVAEKTSGYVVLNIPFSLCQNLKSYQYEEKFDNRLFEIENQSQEIDGQNYLKLTIREIEEKSKIILDYSDSEELKQYFIENPFEFIILSGDENATIKNFVKKSVNNYSFDVEISEETTIELPTLYYLGYTAKIVTDDATVNLKVDISENGFIQINTKSSGTVYLHFEGKYISFANTISIIFMLCFFAFYFTYIYFDKIKMIFNKHKKSIE